MIHIVAGLLIVGMFMWARALFGKARPDTEWTVVEGGRDSLARNHGL